MILHIEIENVDEQAYADIRYVLHRHILKIDGMTDSGEGSGTNLDNPVGVIYEKYRIIREI